MANTTLIKEIFEHNLKILMEEGNNLLIQSKGDVSKLSWDERDRLNNIHFLQSSVFARKNAYDEVMRHDMDITRTMERLGINLDPEINQESQP